MKILGFCYADDATTVVDSTTLKEYPLSFFVLARGFYFLECYYVKGSAGNDIFHVPSNCETISFSGLFKYPTLNLVYECE